MLDENIANSVSLVFTRHGYECEFIRDLIPPGSVDPLVAFVAEDTNAILVSHDGDFQKIAPRIPDGQKKRFRSLSRIHLHCSEPAAAGRLESAISLIESEFSLAQSKRDPRMHIILGTTYIKTSR